MAIAILLIPSKWRQPPGMRDKPAAVRISRTMNEPSVHREVESADRGPREKIEGGLFA
jgi:hypothetical protein